MVRYEGNLRDFCPNGSFCAELSIFDEYFDVFVGNRAYGSPKMMYRTSETSSRLFFVTFN